MEGIAVEFSYPSDPINRQKRTRLTWELFLFLHVLILFFLILPFLLSQLTHFSSLKRLVMHTTTISLLAEIPEGLHQAVAQYLENHPNWDQDRLFAAALSLFLLQTSETADQGKVYPDLEALFRQSV